MDFPNSSFPESARSLLSKDFINESTFSLHLNNTELSFNISNATVGDWRDNYKPVLDFILLFGLVLVMFSMGCDITWQNLLHHIKRPIGLFIGIFSQFVVMPLSAFCILLISGIQGLHATGVLIISCSPGGAASNIFTYFCDGDLSLSVAMTCTSTFLAMGMLPLNIWLYGRQFESEDLVIPYEKMSLSLITVTSPVIVGMIVKWKFPRFAAIAIKLGAGCAVLFTFVCIGMEIVLFPNMFVGIPLKLYVIILSLPSIGLTLGYGLATILRQKRPTRKTIAIECGVQNVPIALTIITLSFPIEVQEDIVLLPLMYGFAMLSGCSVACLAYHFFKRCSDKNSTENNLPGKLEKLDPLLENKGNTELTNGGRIEIIANNLKNGKPVSNIYLKCSEIDV